MTGDYRKTFHLRLADIRTAVLEMAAMVSDTIPRATSALLDSDLLAAQVVIDGDDILDERSINLDNECYQLLALQSPMASDLREVLTAITINSEIERSGDLMVNVAKATRRIYGLPLDPLIRGILVEMSDESRRLLGLAADAYEAGDSALAFALDDMDDHLDQLNYDLAEAILERHSHERRDLRSVVQLALVGRYYERLGDHAVNIGEKVVYLVKGWRPEHTGAMRAGARRNGSFGPLPEASHQDEDDG